MFARSKSKDRGSGSNKVVPPSPSYMSSEQFASFLAELRDSRVKRPGGARPPPPSRREPPAFSSNVQATSLSPFPDRPSHVQVSSPDGTDPTGSHSRASMSGSVASRYSAMMQGRDYYPDRPAKPLDPSHVVPSATYMERGQRWMEKEEAVSLRTAMEEMDIQCHPQEDKDQDKCQEKCQDKRKSKQKAHEGATEHEDEQRIHKAALDEAAELVWQHKHAEQNPQPGAPYRYKAHLRKNSYAFARTAGVGSRVDEVTPTGLARNPGKRSVSGSSSGSDYSTLANGPPGTLNGRRRSFLKRDICGEIQKPFAGYHIWEEPESSGAAEKSPANTTQVLPSKSKNPLNRVQFAYDVRDAHDLSPTDDCPPPPPKLSKVEIHRNPPSQSRNPLYTTNSHSKSPADGSDGSDVPRKHGMEIRNDDIRQATSMRLKDRSPLLPMPSAVSDTPGRPIVSFAKNWKPQGEATDHGPGEIRAGRSLVTGRILQPTEQRSRQQSTSSPHVAVTDGAEDIPVPSASTPSPSPWPKYRSKVTPLSIQVDEPFSPTMTVTRSSPTIPTIVVPDGPKNEARSNDRRPLPTPKSHTAGNSPLNRDRGTWSPALQPVGSRATARCHECDDPIEGRFVVLQGTSERFHPQCFRCYSCGTSLEALEISPEPDHHRAARLDRIARRAAGETLAEEVGSTMAEDGDSRLRLFCHLDWHEQFAPRCKHCKTPILGEHVLALGARWHYGHFFCAECGDPFERGAIHIEKDGYAWCVTCQTKRTERRAPKCRRCRTAVIGQYIQALGGEWHDTCFRCNTCGGGFDDGQIFPLERGREHGETAVLCTGCMQRELKA